MGILRVPHVPVHGASVMRRLALDEAVFRDPLKRSWLVVPELSVPPAGADGGASDNVVVMGLSGKLDELVHAERARADGVAVLRRFSGGGTVVLNAGSLWFTMVTSEPVCAPFPKDVMRWVGAVYAQALGGHVDARMVENDLVVRGAKVAGHAQAISGSRWVHHTSLLWTLTAQQMSYLKLPARRPAYRGDRDHLEFVAGVSALAPGLSQQELIDAVVRHVVEALPAVAAADPLPPLVEPTRNSWVM